MLVWTDDGVPSRTGRYTVIGCKLKQNANEGCNSCAILAGLVLFFIACFILLMIAPLVHLCPVSSLVLSYAPVLAATALHTVTYLC